MQNQQENTKEETAIDAARRRKAETEAGYDEVLPFLRKEEEFVRLNMLLEQHRINRVMMVHKFAEYMETQRPPKKATKKS